ncbi:MAG: nitroreductase family protein [Candidatus Thorarchaeota archaeon]
MTTESDAIEKAADESKADVRIAQGLQALKHVRSRRSIRHFTGKKIPDEHLELILEAARHAEGIPSRYCSGECTESLWIISFRAHKRTKLVCS